MAAWFYSQLNDVTAPHTYKTDICNFCNWDKNWYRCRCLSSA